MLEKEFQNKTACSVMVTFSRVSSWLTPTEHWGEPQRTRDPEQEQAVVNQRLMGCQKNVLDKQRCFENSLCTDFCDMIADLKNIIHAK